MTKFASIQEIPKDWLYEYFKKSKDNFLTGSYLLLDDKKGFMTFDFDEKYFYIHCVYGDGEYWYKLSREIAKKLNLNKIRFATQRNYKAFERKYKAKLIGYVLEFDVDE